jgi:DNA-binding MarR family transcriptional regulator
LDKLETAGFVMRERSTPDRRQVLCQITPSGLDLLAQLDAPVDAVNEAVVATLEDGEKAALVTLLGAVRAACAKADGSEGQGSAREGQPPR